MFIARCVLNSMNNYLWLKSIPAASLLEVFFSWFPAMQRYSYSDCGTFSETATTWLLSWANSRTDIFWRALVGGQGGQPSTFMLTLFILATLGNRDWIAFWRGHFLHWPWKVQDDRDCNLDTYIRCLKIGGMNPSQSIQERIDNLSGELLKWVVSR